MLAAMPSCSQPGHVASVCQLGRQQGAAGREQGHEIAADPGPQQAVLDRIEAAGPADPRRPHPRHPVEQEARDQQHGKAGEYEIEAAIEHAGDRLGRLRHVVWREPFDVGGGRMRREQPRGERGRTAAERDPVVPRNLYYRGQPDHRAGQRRHLPGTPKAARLGRTRRM